MNKFTASSIYLISKHGVSSSYVKVTEGAYDIETSSVVTTEISYSVKLYQKHIRANQYNYPDLIGKEAAIFYLANNNLGFSPAAGDKIIYNSETFTVSSVLKFNAESDTVFFKLISAKG